MIDAGLVGFGFAGKTFHAPVIRATEGLRLAAILQRTGSDAAQRYPDARLVRSMDELLSIESIRLIVIATPNTSHYALARQSLVAGRDVVIDKPFATSYSEAAELLALARKNERLLSVYQNRSWDGDFLTVQQLLGSERLGRIVLFESHFDRFRPNPREQAWRERPEPGSGLLFDLGPHLIDQALLLFGKPKEISADVRIEREGALVDDAFDVVFHYPKMRAALRASVLASTQTPRFALHGTRGGYLKHGLDPQEDALKRGETPDREDWGAEPPERWGTLVTLEGEKLTSEPYPTLCGNYRKFYENVRDAMLGTAPLAVTPERALEVMRALELATQSSRRGCKVAWQGDPN